LSSLDETSKRELKQLNKTPFLDEEMDIMPNQSADEKLSSSNEINQVVYEENEHKVPNDQEVSSEQERKRMLESSDQESKRVLDSSEQRINEIFEKLKQIEDKLEGNSLKVKQSSIENSKRLNRLQKGMKRKSNFDSEQLQKKQKTFFKDESEVKKESGLKRKNPFNSGNQLKKKRLSRGEIEITGESNLKRKNPFDSGNQLKKKKVYFDVWN